MSKTKKSKNTTVSIPESDIWNTILEEKAIRDKIKKEKDKQAAREERKRLREQIKAEIKERKRLEKERQKALKKKKSIEEPLEEPIVEEEPKEDQIEEPKVEEVKQEKVVEAPIQVVQPQVVETSQVECDCPTENAYKYATRIAISILLVFVLFYFFDNDKEYTIVKNSSASYQVNTIDNNTIFINEFNYNEVYQKEENVSYEYYIKSNILVKTPTGTFNKEEKLSGIHEYNNVGDIVYISQSVSIPIDRYNEFARQYLPTKSELTVSLVIIKDNKEESVASLKLLLPNDNYNIGKETITNKTDKYTVEVNIIVKYILLSSIFLLIEYIVYNIVKLVLFLLKTVLKSK